MPPNVFITGASSGLGEALARAYGDRGAILGLVARRKPRLDALLAQVHATGRAYEVDVTDTPVLHDAAQLHLHEFGCPDIVIANAGVSAGTLTEMPGDLDVFARIVDTNLIATVATFQPFIAAMKARRGGTLVAISSVAGVRGLPGAGAYSASKAAVTTYCESLRLEMRPYGIRVVTIAPGYVDTPMTRGNRYPMPFLLTPEAFARRALRAIDNGDRYRVIPWQMGWIAKLIRALPNAWYDGLFARAPRKARAGAPICGGLPDRGSSVALRAENDRRAGPPTFTGDLFEGPSDLHAFAIDAASEAGPDDVPRARVKTWRERATWPQRRS